MKKYAVFIAGDHNIFFPAVVAINSIKEFNKHLNLDYFIIFDGNKLDVNMINIMSKYNIKFIDSKEILKFGSIDDLEVMHEAQWPKEVFLNWLAPSYFYKEGYDIAIKADYDLLCIDSWNEEDINLKEEVFSSHIWNTQNLLKDGVDFSILSKYGFLNESEAIATSYMNVGFVVINLQFYNDYNCFSLFKKIYNDIVGCKKVNVAEQAAISVLIKYLKLKTKNISCSYNYRITTILPDNFYGKVKNIHFLTSNKPWRELSFKYAKAYISDNRVHLYLFRQIWLDYASKFSEFNQYVKITSSLTPNENIANINTMFKMIYASK